MICVLRTRFFEQVMDDALAHHPNAKCYIDDVLIFFTTFEHN